MADALGRPYGALQLTGRTDGAGQLAYVSLVDGQNNAFVGLNAGTSLPGTNNTFLGSYSGSNASSINDTVFVGTSTGRRASSITNSVYLGFRSGELSNRVDCSVSIGAYAGRKMQRATCNTLIGYSAGAELTSGNRNTVLGSYAAFSQFNASDNVCLGHRAGYNNTIGANNCYVGTNAGFAAYDANENVAIGALSGQGLTSGLKNVLLGYAAGANIAQASNCIAIGTEAMEFFYNGDTNTCIGTRAARNFTGVYNTIVGGYSSSNAVGNYNTVVGSHSMNRPAQRGLPGGVVGLSNCVVLGENIQFDIPVRKIVAYPPNLDLVPSQQVIAANSSSVSFTVPSTAFLTVNFVPIGDPLPITDRYLQFGTATSPVWLDTSVPGRFSVQWGSAIDTTATVLTLLPPVPVRLVVDSTATAIHVSAYVYEHLSTSWSLDPAPQLGVVLTQAFDPPSVQCHLETATQVIDQSVPGIFPGLNLGVQRVVSSTPSTVTVYATEATQYLVPGMEVQIVHSVVDVFNGIWRIASVGPVQNDGSVPIVIQVPFAFSGNDIGPSAAVYLSRSITIPVVAPVGLRVSAPQLAGTLFGTETTQAYFDGTGDIARGVYDLDIVNPYQGLFDVAASTDSITGNTTFLGNVTIGTFEPLVVGVSVTASYDITGPTDWDGHVQSGAGSQQQMDANVSQQVLEFTDSGYEYAQYTLFRQATNLSAQGTFDVPISTDIVVGLEWFDQYDVRLLKHGTGMDIVLFSGGQLVADFAETTISGIVGSLSTARIPLDLADPLATPNPRVTCSIVYTLGTLRITVSVQGGTRVDPTTNVFVPSGQPVVAVITTQVPTQVAPSDSVRYYANAFTKLQDVSMSGIPEPPGTIVTANAFSITYSQRSDTGLHDILVTGPTAFDGHVHRGAGTQASMDIDIRANVLTFTSLGYSAADYQMGSLSTSMDVSVAFDNLLDGSFGIEWLNSMALRCTLSGGLVGTVLEYTPLSRTIMSANASVFGRMITDIRAYDGGQMVEAQYPLSLTWLNGTPRALMHITHHIVAKTLSVQVRLLGGTREIDLTASLAALQDIVINTTSGLVSIFADTAVTATALSIVNTSYPAYPSFENCIFVGSNFVVGNNIETIDQERSNVFIAAIGTTRLFRGRLDEFRFFSSVVAMPVVTLEGDASGNATLVVTSPTGNAALIEGSSTMDGAVIINGPTAVNDALSVQGGASFADVVVHGTIGVSGDASFSSNVDVYAQTTTHGHLVVASTGLFEDVVTMRAELDASTVVATEITSANVSVSDAFSVFGPATFAGNADVYGQTTQYGPLVVASTGLFEDVVTMRAELDANAVVATQITCDAVSASNVTAGSISAGYTHVASLDVDGSVNVYGQDVYIRGVGVTDSLGALGTSINNAQNDIATLQTDVTNAQNDIVTLQTDVTNAQNDIVNLQTDVTNLQTDVGQLQTDLGAVDANVSYLQTDMTNAQNDIANLQTDVSQLDTSKVNRAGDTITGTLVVDGDIVMNGSSDTSQDVAVITIGNAIRRSTNSFVVSSTLSQYLPLSAGIGSSLTGSLYTQQSVYALNKVVAGTNTYGGGATLYCTGTCVIENNLYVNGNSNLQFVSKTGGSFDIEHPILANTRLIHSFVEGPRCDLIYRGTTTLLHGSAIVTIDAECVADADCAMTTGTFEALVANPDVFVHNQSDFDRVRAWVDGGTVHIVCENPRSTARVSWLVVGERADTGVARWDRTNRRGFLQTEHPAK